MVEHLETVLCSAEGVTQEIEFVTRSQLPERHRKVSSGFMKCIGKVGYNRMWSQEEGRCMQVYTAVPSISLSGMRTPLTTTGTDRRGTWADGRW